jgi:hypothetical protein
MERLKLLKIKALAIVIMCLSTFNCIAQNIENLKIEIPSVLIAGSNFKMVFVNDKIIKTQIPEIKNFIFVDSTRSRSSYIKDGKKCTNHALIIKYKTSKPGLYTIPTMVLYTNIDTIIIDKRIIKVIPSDTFENRIIDSTIMLPFIKNYSEFNKESDIIANATIDKNQVHIGDTIIANFTIYNGLSNLFYVKNISNISQKGLNYKLIKNTNELDQFERINSKNYQTIRFTWQIIPTQTGNFSFDSIAFTGLLEYTDSIPLLLELDEEHEIPIHIPKFNFDVIE